VTAEGGTIADEPLIEESLDKTPTEGESESIKEVVDEEGKTEGGLDGERSLKRAMVRTGERSDAGG